MSDEFSKLFKKTKTVEPELLLVYEKPEDEGIIFYYKNLLSKADEAKSSGKKLTMVKIADPVSEKESSYSITPTSILVNLFNKLYGTKWNLQHSHMGAMLKACGGNHWTVARHLIGMGEKFQQGNPVAYLQQLCNNAKTYQAVSSEDLPTSAKLRDWTILNKGESVADRVQMLQSRLVNYRKMNPITPQISDEIANIEKAIKKLNT